MKSRFITLATVTLLLTLATGMAFGQGATLVLGSNPTRVRDAGVTEPVGLITLANNTSTNQVIGSAVATNMDIVFDAPVTNVVAPTTFGTSTTNANIFLTGVGSAFGAGVAATFVAGSSVLTITVPAASTITIAPGGSLNIAGIRVNASLIAAGTPIRATVTTTPANALSFPGGRNDTIVARPQQGLVAGSIVGLTTGAPVAFAVGGATATTTSPVGTIPAPVLLCQLFTTPALLGAGNIASATIAGAPVVGVTFSEPGDYAQSFTTTVQEASFTPLDTVLNGARVDLLLTGVLAGVNVFVPEIIAQGGLTMTLVNPATNAPFAGADGTFLRPYVPTTAGTLTISYQVTVSSLTTVESMTAPLFFTFTGATFTTGPFGAVSVRFSPITSATSTRIVRFADRQTALTGNLGRVSECVTFLLFPWVVFTGTFDTGMVVANTSTDIFGTVPQAGSLTFTFFGSPASATDPIPAPVVFNSPASVRSGDTLSVLASAVLSAGFRGYAIARANFQFAHGFAFIVDGYGLAAPRSSEAYLAMIIPDPAIQAAALGTAAARLAAPDAFGALLGAFSGEALKH